MPHRKAPLLEIGVVESGEDQTYKCPLCQEMLPSQNNFTMHIRAHNEVKPSPDPNDPTGQAKVYYCCLCGKMLSSFSSLDRHMLVHSGERPFSCQLCGQTFTTNGNMHRHKRTHGARESHLIVDDSTDHVTPRRGGGRKRSLPSPGSGSAGRVGKVPKQDGLNVARGGSLSASRGRGGRVRKLVQQKSFVDENAENQLEAFTGHLASSMPIEKSLRCFVCNESFPSEISLETHILSMHPTEKVSCEECNFTCPNYSILKLHRSMFHLINHVGLAGNNNGPMRPLDFTAAQPPSLNHLNASNTPSSQASILQSRIEIGKPGSAFLTHQQQQHHQQLLANTLLGPQVPGLNQASMAASVNSPVGISALTHSAISAAAEAAAAAARGLNSDVLLQGKNLISNSNAQSLVGPDDSSNDHDEIDVDDIDDNDEDTRVENGQDLADVHSMMSIAKQCTSSFRSNNEDSQSDSSSVQRFDPNQPSDGSGSLKEDPLIRDMKMRGEFPCRLCPAVYPNLRALKGHNKEHLGKAPYSCNVGSCTYSSNDKSTLTRHMRTHTGEKPFECKLCNYGFTTKANCERHLKNKHGKTSRDAIRNAIIIHETEDGPNGEERSGLEGQFRCKVCKSIFPSSAKVISHAITEHPAYANEVDHIFEEIKSKDSQMDMEDDLSCPSMVPRTNNFPNLREMRPLASSASPAANSDNSCASFNNDTSGPDAPLDLSRPSKEPAAIANKEISFANLPVLKLQGKFPVLPPSMLDAASLAKLTPVTSCGPTAQAAVAAAVVSGLLPPNFPFMIPATNPAQGSPFPFLLPPFANPSNMAAAAAAAMTSLFPNLDSFPPEIREKLASDMKQKLLQFPLLATPPSVAADAIRLPPTDVVSDYVTMQRELLRKQAAEIKEQKEAAETLQHLSQVQTLAAIAPPISRSSQADVEMKNEGGGGGGSNGQTSSQRDTEDDDANYKMVIKNGVLMKKQKQRRYRTERPYGCNYCSARFTLRSNMERHIKQQHPEHWCQKPRGSRRNHSATVPVLAPQFQQGVDGEDEEDEEEEEGVLDREGSTIDDDGDEDGLVIDEPDVANDEEAEEEDENAADLVSVSKLLNSASSQSFQKYFDRSVEEEEEDDGEEKDQNSDIAISQNAERKKSAYSAAPHKICCPYCSRKFPWTSSLNRHILTHTGQKPYKCRECPLWFTTKSNCDRHVIRKHGGVGTGNNNNDQSFTARNAPDRPYKCQMCPSSTFSSRSNLKKHQFARHQAGNGDHVDGGSSADDEDEGFEYDDDLNGHDLDEGVLNGEARFRCHICQHPVQVFAGKLSALDHLRSRHAQDYDQLVKVGEVSKAEAAATEDVKPNPDPAKPISCLFCSLTFESQKDFQEHVFASHVTKPEVDNLNCAPKVEHVGVVQLDEKSQVKKKQRLSLMDKINQLTTSAAAANATAASVQNVIANQEKEANSH